MFNNILQYYYITNYFHSYLMYVIALPIIILKQLFLYSIGCLYKKKYDQPIILKLMRATE